MDRDLSIVIPVYNEKDSLVELHREIDGVLTAAENTEIIFVDDGSSDGGAEVLREIAAQDPRVRVVRLVRNYGKSAAYAAGFEAARGAFVVTMDADLQDDPRELPRLLKALEDRRLDLVMGWKQGRDRNEPSKSFPSRIYNGIKGRLFGLTLHDSNCGFRVMRRAVAESLLLYGDQYRFIPELAHLRGFRVGEVRVHHRRRIHGRSKYGPMRFWTGLLDLVNVRFLTSYAPKPLHFFGRISLPPIMIGIILEFYVLVRKILGSTFQMHVAAIIIGTLLILIGVQLLSIGLVCEMISAQGNGPRYYVRERLGFPNE